MKLIKTANPKCLRTCVLSKKVYDKTDLIRIVRVGKTTVEVDLEQKLLGRGMYFKKAEHAVEKLKQKNLIFKILKVKVTNEWYELLNSKINK